MTEQRWRPRYGEPGTEVHEPLDVNREARIRQLHEDLGSEETLAALGARTAIADLLAEVSRLRRLVTSMGGDPDEPLPGPSENERRP